MPVELSSNTVTNAPSLSIESSSRSFTGVELATAVICTHIMTLAGVILTMVLCHRRRQAARRHGEMAAIMNQPHAPNDNLPSVCRGGKPAVIVNHLSTRRFKPPITRDHNGDVISHVNGYMSSYHQPR